MQRSNGKKKYEGSYGRRGRIGIHREWYEDGTLKVRTEYDSQGEKVAEEHFDADESGGGDKEGAHDVAKMEAREALRDISADGGAGGLVSS